MPDPACSLLLLKILDGAELFVRVRRDVPLVDIVHEIEVHVVGLKLSELFREDLFLAAEERNVVARELRGQIKTVPRIVFQDLSHDPLGVLSMVAVGRVEVVDAVPKRVGDHFRHLVFVDPGIVIFQNRETHAAEAEGRDSVILKLLVNHGGNSFFFYSIIGGKKKQ